MSLTKQQLLHQLSHPDIPHDSVVTIIVNDPDATLSFTAAGDQRTWEAAYSEGVLSPVSPQLGRDGAPVDHTPIPVE